MNPKNTRLDTKNYLNIVIIISTFFLFLLILHFIAGNSQELEIIISENENQKSEQEVYVEKKIPCDQSCRRQRKEERKGQEFWGRLLIFLDEIIPNGREKEANTYFTGHEIYFLVIFQARKFLFFFSHKKISKSRNKNNTDPNN